MNNPYQSPENQTDIYDGELSEQDLEDAAKGQKFLIYSLVGSFIFNAALNAGLPFMLTIIGLIGLLALAINGILKISRVTNYSLGIKIVSIIALFIPLISLIVMIVYSMKATKVLKEAGYEVGFFGVKS